MDQSFGNLFKRANMSKGSEPEIVLKIVFVGSSGVGAKSSFVIRYVRKAFDEAAEPTVGACFLTKNVLIKGKKVKLQIWDTAGQERFMSLMPMYYMGAAGIVVGYDITSRDSFETAKRRYINLRRECPGAVLMVVGNKVDRENDRHWGREVSYEEGDELANEVGAPLFFETSAKTGFNVNESMNAFIEEILMTKRVLDETND